MTPDVPRAELGALYLRDHWYVYGRWIVRPEGLPERQLGAALGVPEHLREAAKAQGSWSGLVQAWHPYPDDWQRVRPPFASPEEAQAYMDVLSEHAVELLEAHLS